MVKQLLKVLVLAVCLHHTSASAQVVKCADGKTYWILHKDSLSYSAELHGNVTTNDQPNTILLDNDALHCNITLKSKYAEAGGKNADFKLMFRHAATETNDASKQLKAKLKLQVQSAPVGEETDVLIWFYNMPEGGKQEVKAQVHASMVMGGQIVTFSSPQLNGQEFDAVKDLLLEVISTLKVANILTTPCNN